MGKNRPCANFNRTLTNTSKLRKLNIAYDKNTISAMFSFRRCQEAFYKASINISVLVFLFDILTGCLDIFILSWSS